MENAKQSLPTHIAIIMDGNRRWAKSQGKPAGFGHKAGAKTIENIVRYANRIGLQYITVYAFSTENWKRAEEEVSGLMLLLQNYLSDYAKRADTENIRIKVLGDITKFPEGTQKSINDCIERTKENTGITFSIALNYGGRAEILEAIKKIALDIKENKVKENDITEELIDKYLYTRDIPDPDLIIRTSGEQRLSGFLAWQSTYSELHFIQKNWPDFTENDLDQAIAEYNRRTRKFGAN